MFTMAGMGVALGPWPAVRRAHGMQFVTRQDAAHADPGAVALLEGAVKEMMDRSRKNAADPRGWLSNARAHADFCAAPSNAELQVHFCWWFLSWHRAYLIVTERKLREMTGKSAIAFPYWNWSSDRAIPAAYANEGSPLAAALRHTPRRPITDGEVDYFRSDPVRSKLGVAALGAARFQAADEREIGSSFGGIARPNETKRYGNSRLEGVPHGPIHNYVGGYMADFETAARDPIFFAHHGNLDKLWEIWRSDPEKRATEPRDLEFLKHQFPFSWIDGSTTLISVEETLSTERLGYRYDSLSVFRGAPPPLLETAELKARPLRPILTTDVAVPRSVNESRDSSRRYTLVISDIAEPTRPMTVEVRVRRPEDRNAVGVLVGSFSVVLSGGKVVFPDRTLRFDVTDAVRRLRSSSLAVSLVPLSLASEQETVYPPLRYGSIAITTD
jgi:Common central domain of tyrosinase